ncbi:hypothetical protein Tco_0706968 [Tanacetum coccineum]|uniref:Integrase, catalytic region, zinc finger, CCHC-type, peptidase aspartic, catalytic n=1 Tax=Tanacetum coccineum TaxID=301880 RepID=A0ABQ4YB46_9ASTR
MTTLAEHIIVAGAENHPPMLEKSMYASWASRIRLFIKGKKYGRMMLDSIDNGQLVYPTVEENGQTRPKKYSELTEAQPLQDDCDVQATNIILHVLPPDMYALLNHQELINDMHTIRMTMQQVQVNTKFLNALPPEWSKFVTDVKLAKSLYTIQSMFQFISIIRHNMNDMLMKQPFKMEESQFNKFKEDKFRILDEEQLAFIADPGIAEVQVAQQTIPQNSAFQTKDLDAYDLNCDDISSAKAVLMENLSSCDSDVLSEESQNAGIQDTNSSAPNDLLVLSLVEQLTDHVANLDKKNQTNKMVNESLTAELEIYKERKEKESLSTTLTIFKTECKEKESKYMYKEIVLENQNKELKNTLCKLYRSTQAMHMLTKPYVFYDNTRKHALGYENPFHLRKAQRIKPTLYDGSVIAKEQDVKSVIDDEETLILEKESRSKMLDKQNDPISIKQ